MEENKEILDSTTDPANTADEDMDVNILAEENASEELELATDESGNYYPSTYVVYGMAIGVAVGAIVMALTDSRLLLSACVFLGTIIGYFIKKGDSNGK